MNAPITEVRRCDLVLRDMGYFSLSEFTVIEELEAWRLTCLPLTTGAVSADGRILEQLLKSSKAPKETLSTSIPSSGNKAKSAVSWPCKRTQKSRQLGGLSVVRKPGIAARIPARKDCSATAGTSC